jgi:hypothetical protein
MQLSLRNSAQSRQRRRRRECCSPYGCGSQARLGVTVEKDDLHNYRMWLLPAVVRLSSFVQIGCLATHERDAHSLGAKQYRELALKHGRGLGQRMGALALAEVPRFAVAELPGPVGAVERDHPLGGALADQRRVRVGVTDTFRSINHDVGGSGLVPDLLGERLDHSAVRSGASG